MIIMAVLNAPRTENESEREREGERERPGLVD